MTEPHFIATVYFLTRSLQEKKNLLFLYTFSALRTECGTKETLKRYLQTACQLTPEHKSLVPRFDYFLQVSVGE